MHKSCVPHQVASVGGSVFSIFFQLKGIKIKAPCRKTSAGPAFICFSVVRQSLPGHFFMRCPQLSGGWDWQESDNAGNLKGRREEEEEDQDHRRLEGKMATVSIKPCSSRWTRITYEVAIYFDTLPNLKKKKQLRLRVDPDMEKFFGIVKKGSSVIVFQTTGKNQQRPNSPMLDKIGPSIAKSKLGVDIWKLRQNMYRSPAHNRK